MSHDIKVKVGLTKETKEQMRERVGRELNREIVHYHEMKEVLQQQANTTTPCSS